MVSYREASWAYSSISLTSCAYWIAVSSKILIFPIHLAYLIYLRRSKDSVHFKAISTRIEIRMDTHSYPRPSLSEMRP